MSDFLKMWGKLATCGRLLIGLPEAGHVLLALKSFPVVGQAFTLRPILNRPAGAQHTSSVFQGAVWFQLCCCVEPAILPAAGFPAGSALDVQSPPAGWKAGCSQDWLPHAK